MVRGDVKGAVDNSMGGKERGGSGHYYCGKQDLLHRYGSATVQCEDIHRI